MQIIAAAKNIYAGRIRIANELLKFVQRSNGGSEILGPNQTQLLPTLSTTAEAKATVIISKVLVTKAKALTMVI